MNKVAESDLSTRLTECWPRHRCMSGACPSCGRAIQRYFVAEAQKLLVAEATNTKIVSLVLDHQYPRGDLGKSPTIQTLQQRAKDVLGNSGVDFALGGVDLSFNEDRDEHRFEEHWAPQLWFVLPSHNLEQWIKALRKAYPSSSAVPRPVKVLNWDGDPAALAYALKTNFVRRVSITTTNKKNRVTRKIRNTRAQRLRAIERTELYRFLHNSGLSSRFFLLGCRVTRTNDGFSITRVRNSQISGLAQRSQLGPQNPLERAQR